MDSGVEPSRRDRARARTRLRLIAGARELIGRRGLEAVTIAELTARADIGFGTFYGYFASKQDLTREAVADALERLGRANDELTRGLEDPAEVLSAAVRNTLALVDRQPQWALFLVRVAYSDDRAVWSSVHARVARDLRGGMTGGRFRIEDPETVAHLVAGSVLSAVRARIEGHLAAPSDAEVAMRILVMLGVPAGEALAISTRSLPTIDHFDEETSL